MIGANAIFPAIIITLICYGIAIVALSALLVGIFLWRKRRRLSLMLLIPSVLYLVPFLYFFTPRPLPHHLLTIDLRKPTDLSGFPAGTKWSTAIWPPPKTIVPLSPAGASTAVEGRVDFSIILPDGQILHDVGREVYIDVDDAGIWKIEIWVENVKPQKALENLKAYLWPLALHSGNQERASEEMSEIESHLKDYVPKAPIELGYFRFKYPGYTFDFTLTTTFMPSDRVSYRYAIEVPHVPLEKRFTPLPPVDHPEQLVQDCRAILDSGTAHTVAKAQWPPSISQINPSSVHLYNGNVLMVFDINPLTGYHCYAVSSENQAPDPRHIFVKAVPYPGLKEVWWHDQSPSDLQ